MMIIDCPSCSRKLRVPDSLLGKQVRCPTCGHQFEAAAAAAAPAPGAEAQPTPPPLDVPLNLELEAPGPATEPTREAPAPPITPGPARLSDDEAMTPCPSCGKPVPDAALSCPHCGENLDDLDEEFERPRPPVRRDAEPHRGGLILTLGIISIVTSALGCTGPIGLPLGIIAWVLGQRDLRKIREGMMDPEGLGQTQAGWICGIIGTILDSLCIAGWLVYIAFIFTMFRTMQTMPPPNVTTRPVTPTRKTGPVKKAELEHLPQRLADYLPRAYA
jgi:predicted Zn finger-like uncharacterized protein